MLSKRSGRVIAQESEEEEVTRALEKLHVRGNTDAFLVSIDTEGTARSGGIREIAACCVERPRETFADIVTPVSKVAGLSAEDAARTWAEVGPRFFAWLAERGQEPGAARVGARPIVLVAHNAHHDAALLRRETLAQCPQCVSAELRIADTLAAVRAELPELKRRDQASVYKHLFGAAPARAHTALADAIANASIARELTGYLKEHSKPLFLSKEL